MLFVPVLTLILSSATSAFQLSETVERDVWTNLADGDLNLVSLSAYATAYDEGSTTKAPTFSSVLANGLEATGLQPSNYAVGWGMRVRGFLVPAQTASYTFWIEGDDTAEFWLSTNSSESGKLNVVSLTVPSDGDYTDDRKSSPIELTAHGVYYLELIYKDAGGNSRISVAWSTSDTHSPTAADIIPASVVSSFSKGAHYAATYGPSRTLDRSYWTQLTQGDAQRAVSTLTSLEDYPHNPTGSDLVGDGFVFRDFATINLADTNQPQGINIGIDRNNKYGQRIRGYIAPAESGSYTFYINSRGPSELRLSVDGASPTRICGEPGQHGHQYEYASGDTKSSSQSLQAGELHQFELYHVVSQADSQDFVNVAWRLNDDPATSPDRTNIIPATVLHAHNLPIQTTTVTTGSWAFTDVSTGTTSTMASVADFSTGTTSTMAYTGVTTGTTSTMADVITGTTSTMADVVTGTTSTMVAPSCGTGACLLSETVSRDVWTWTTAAQAGSSLDLITFTALTEAPTSSSILANGLEATSLAAQDFANQFGQRVSGFLVPDQTARYTFWIEGDDEAELWLSTNRTESGKVRVASLHGHSTVATGYNFHIHATQKSSPVNLTAGNVYYLEILHKDHIAADRVTVVWSTDANHNPDSTELPSQDLIPASVLSSFSKGADYAAIYGPSRTLDRSYWTGTDGINIGDMALRTPTGSDIVGDGSIFRSWATRNLGAFYGQRIRGYIVPPESGYFYFHLNSHPQAEFRLSTNDNPDNAAVMCQELSASGQQYIYSTSVTCGKQYLGAWQLYYFELYHTKPSGSTDIEDFVNVAWRLDSITPTQSDIIPASALHAYGLPIQTTTATTTTTATSSTTTSSTASTSSSTTSTSSWTSSSSSTSSLTSTSSSSTSRSTSTTTSSTASTSSSTTSSSSWTSTSSSTSSWTTTSTSSSSTSRSTSTTTSSTASTSSSTTSSSSWTSSVTITLTSSTSSSSKTTSTTSSETSTTSSATLTSTSSQTSSTSTETTSTTTYLSTATSTGTTTSSSSSTATSTSTTSSTLTMTSTTFTATSSTTSSISTSTSTTSSSSGITTVTSSTTTPSRCYNTPLVLYGGNHSHCLGLKHGEECEPRCVPGHRMVGGIITCIDGTFSVEGTCLEDTLADAVGSLPDAAQPTRAAGVVINLEVSVGPQSTFTYSWVQENYQLVLESIASILDMDPRFISLEIVVSAIDPVGRLLQSADSSFEMRVRSMLPADLNTSTAANEETDVLEPLRRKFIDMVWVPQTTGGYHLPALFVAIAHQAETVGVPVPEGLQDASLSAGSTTDHASDMFFMPPVWILDPWSSCSCPSSVQTRTIHCMVDHLASCDGGSARPSVEEPCLCPEETSPLGLAVAVGGGVAGLLCLLVCCFVCRRLSRRSSAGSARLLDNKEVTVKYVIKYPSKSVDKTEEIDKVHVVWDVNMADLEALMQEVEEVRAAKSEKLSSFVDREETVAPTDSEPSSDLVCSMFSHGDPIEYFSRTHKCWLHGTVRVKFVHSEQGMQAVYFVHLDSSGQWRHDVPADQLRTPLRDREPVDIFCHRNGGIWVPGFVCCDEVTRAKCQAYGRPRYHVLLQAPASTVLEEVPAERLRRRFPPGCQVQVFRAQRGWVNAKVSDAPLNDGDSLVSIVESEGAGPELIPGHLVQCDLEQFAPFQP